MDQIQQRALNSLEPFLALSKSAVAPRAASDLITQATSAANTYVFAELLQTRNIQALRNSGYASHLKLLEIFSWGTYGDYVANSSSLPPLNPQQELKLRLLTLLPLLTTSLPTPSDDSTTDPLSYAYLQSQLSLDAEALESLITTALADGLITGHLDPLHQRVAISSVAPLRDLAPQSMPSMIETLANWDARCSSTLEEIEQRVANIYQEAARRQEMERRREKAFEAKIVKADQEDPKGLMKGGKRMGPPGMNGGMRDDQMEIDEPGGGKRGKKMVGRLAGMAGMR